MPDAFDEFALGELLVAEHGFTVLVVDDEPDIRELLTFNLQRLGVNVIEAKNAREALRTIYEKSPDMAFFDIHMPGEDGFDLTRAVRRDPRTADLPIVLLSASAQEASIAEGAHSGANGYVMKPFTRPSLEGVLERYLGEAFAEYVDA